MEEERGTEAAGQGTPEPLQEPAGWAVPAPAEAIPGEIASAAVSEPMESSAATGAPSAGDEVTSAAARPAATSAPAAAPEAWSAAAPAATAADVQAELRLQRALDAQLDRVVQLGRELVNTRLFGQAGQPVELREPQLRNAVAVANETDSLEVVKNWVYYQVARPDGRGWRQGGFADGLVAHLEGDLERLAGSVAANAGTPERAREAHLRLARLYLGYLSRHFAYRQHERERAVPGAPAPPAAGRPPGTAPQPGAGGRQAARGPRPGGPRPAQAGPAAPPERPAASPESEEASVPVPAPPEEAVAPTDVASITPPPERAEAAGPSGREPAAEGTPAASGEPTSAAPGERKPPGAATPPAGTHEAGAPPAGAPPAPSAESEPTAREQPTGGAS